MMEESVSALKDCSVQCKIKICKVIVVMHCGKNAERALHGLLWEPRNGAAM